MTSVVDTLKPRYSELTTYLAALTCVVLAFAYPDFGILLSDLFSGAGADDADVALAVISLTGIAAVGFVLSVLHVFTKRTKEPWERTCMGVFALGANGLAGMLSGIEMFSSHSPSCAFFPIWNIATGASLLYQIGLNRFEVTQEDATPVEVAAASLVLLVAYALSAQALRLSWAATFSICMFYSSVFVFILCQVRRLLRSLGLSHYPRR
ncbi:MAG: hypothetical protein QMD04_11470 [Anaerolineales bacterium]|nr:hypothetical protein [Anaerolineales bacterium]